MFGPFATTRFQLINEVGDTTQTVALQQGDASAAGDEFVGMLTAPAKNFRVVASGVDNHGTYYQRIFPTLFRAQPVEVTVGDPIPDLFSSKTSRITFIVRNSGNPDTFQIVVNATPDFVFSVHPSTFELTNGAIGKVKVDITVPHETPAGTGIEISLTAASTADPTIVNGAIIDLTVSPRPIE